ncbi:class F sortase [Streptomyces sp. NBC_00448]|uniref:class F sortase n=1 Tax=Streptomyces sp. NBC_00448 TaxID=2903652 RepID=UPI002E1ED5E6
MNDDPAGAAGSADPARAGRPEGPDGPASAGPGAPAGPDDPIGPAHKEVEDAGPGRTRNSRRTAALLVAFAVACVATGVTVILAGAGGGAKPPPQAGPAAAGTMPGMPGMPHVTASGVPAPTTAAGTPAAGGALPASRPTGLDIPAIGVHSDLLDLGLNKNGTLEVPGKPLQAGWYRNSPAPGQVGPSVILGHVDSYATGPAVFYRLGALRPHERITVTRADRKTAVFTIDALRSYEKRTFPTLDVYGNTSDPELRLITCGDWNARTHGYDGNTVVFAHLLK